VNKLQVGVGSTKNFCHAAKYRDDEVRQYRVVPITRN